jgi:hypothetical protein
MAETLADLIGLTNGATLTIESGVASPAAKGVVIVGGGRGQFDLTLAAALPPCFGKISHVVSLKKKRPPGEAAS